MLEFGYAISKIMKIYDAKYIKIQGDSVFGIFEGSKKEQIEKCFDCCVDLNTFKYHLNKVIWKYLMKGDYDEYVHKIDYRIGMWFSFDNYMSRIGHKTTKDIVFSGDAVNYANKYN